MRVVKVVTNNAVPYDRRVWLEAVTLATAGHEVTVVCPREPDAPEGRVRLEGIDIERYRLPFEGRSSIGLVAEFAWSFVAVLVRLVSIRMRKGPIDVLHAANPPETLWPIAWIMQRGRTRFVFDHHDLSPEMYVAKGGRADDLAHRALVWMERRTFRQADLVISTNGSYADLARPRGGVSNDKIVVVRSAPDVSRWSVTAPDPQVAKDKQFVVGYLGEMGDQDGIEHLLEAAAIVRRSRNDIQYVLVGDGPHQSALVGLSRRLNLTDCVTFTGRQTGDDLCRVMSSMHVAVSPDPRTPWSDRSTMNKIVDYMFFGIPLVSYALTESIVSAGEEAALFVADGPDHLAAGIIELLDDPIRRTRMGEAGARRLRTELAWEFSARALLDAYAGLEA